MIVITQTTDTEGTCQCGLKHSSADLFCREWGTPLGRFKLVANGRIVLSSAERIVSQKVIICTECGEIDSPSNVPFCLNCGSIKVQTHTLHFDPARELPLTASVDIYRPKITGQLVQ